MNLNMQDKESIDQVTGSFFSIFNNVDQQPNWDLINSICIPQTIIIKKEGLEETVYTLQSFVEPRKKILSDGTLTHFKEWETGEETKIISHIAQRFSTYEKTGKLQGESFHGRGYKFFQFIQTSGGWKINAVIWEDEK